MDEVWTELSWHCFHQAENEELSPISTLDTALHPSFPTAAQGSATRLEPSPLINLLYLCSQCWNSALLKSDVLLFVKLLSQTLDSSSFIFCWSKGLQRAQHFPALSKPISPLCPRSTLCF